MLKTVTEHDPMDGTEYNLVQSPCCKSTAVSFLGPIKESVTSTKRKLLSAVLAPSHGISLAFVCETCKELFVVAFNSTRGPQTAIDFGHRTSAPEVICEALVQHPATEKHWGPPKK